MPRRDFVRRVGMVAAGVALPGRRRVRRSQGDHEVFAHGVASGDPLPDRVVLWTRVSGRPGTVAVRWRVATDPGLADVVAQGEVATGPERDWTVHVDANGLRPRTSYWFAFEAEGRPSPVGRTRTAADDGDDDEEVRLGLVSCSSFASGPFTVYRRLAAHDVDLVVHLGDYVYEAEGSDTVRSHDPPGEARTLADYRRRHAQHRGDPDLQDLHARHPVAAVWDDHDVAGNAWRDGAGAHDPATDGPWEARRAAALQAWREWVPLRSPEPGRPERIWRRLPLGATGELLLLDTRHDQRSEPVSRSHPDPAAAVRDPDRQLFSPEQRTWLSDALRRPRRGWRLVANQVVLSPLGVAVPRPLASLAENIGLVVDGRVVNPDQWDGYRAERQRLLDVLGEPGVEDVIVLTGDVHSSWAMEVPPLTEPAPGPAQDAAPVAVELVVPSVSSESFARIVGADAPLLARGLEELLDEQLPHLRWAELSSHGYVVLGLTDGRAHADWWHVDLTTGEERRAASWVVERGDPSLVAADRALPPRGTTGPSPLPPGAGSTEGDSSALDRVGPLAGAAAAGAALLAGLVALRRRRDRT